MTEDTLNDTERPEEPGTFEEAVEYDAAPADHGTDRADEEGDDRADD